MTFASKEGHIYTANVYDKDYSGSIVTLTGGPEPFTTEEDDDDDFFAPLRGQTGYLRVIDDTGTGMLMDDIVPDNNTQRMVRLCEGEAVRWQGFIQAQAYSQDWDPGTKLIEFPVKSFLAALEDLKMTSEISSPVTLFSTIIRGAEKLAGINPFDSVICASDIKGNPLDVFMDNGVLSSFFFSSQSSNVEGRTSVSYVGISYYEAWQKMLAFLGVTARENGRTLIFEQFDHPACNLKYSVTSWADFASGSWTKGSGTMADIAAADLLGSVEFRDHSNSIGYSTGANVVKVELDIKNIDLEITLPPVEENADTPYEFYDGKTMKAKMIVQVHTSVDSEVLKYNFRKYDIHVQKYSTDPQNYLSYEGESDFSGMLNHTILKGYSDYVYVFSGYGTKFVNTERYTGAFPVRFYYKADEKSVGSLSDGMWIQTQYFFGLQDQIAKDNFTPEIILTLSSVNVLDLENGYLNLKFSLYSIHDNEGDQYKNVNLTDGNNPTVILRAYLKIGDKYYDEQNKTWTTDVKPIVLNFTNGNIVSNKTKDMLTTSNEGYFAPVAGEKGVVTFQLLDVNYYYPTSYHGANVRTCCALIMYSFALSYLPRYAQTASSADKNLYQQVILINGFSSEKRIDLDMGTINNNQDSPSFVRNTTDAGYLTQLTYNGMAGEYTERPELHLLDRMAKYYARMRRNMKATLKAGLDLVTTIYTYRGRNFFGIDAKHNWRDDTQEVTFMEFTNDKE